MEDVVNNLDVFPIEINNLLVDISGDAFGKTVPAGTKIPFSTNANYTVNTSGITLSNDKKTITLPKGKWFNIGIYGAGANVAPACGFTPATTSNTNYKVFSFNGQIYGTTPYYIQAVQYIDTKNTIDISFTFTYQATASSSYWLAWISKVILIRYSNKSSLD